MVFNLFIHFGLYRITMREFFLLPKTIATHLFGPHHTYTHRICIGLCIAASGLSLTYTSVMFVQPFHYLIDFVGMSFHGIGIVPIIERMTEGGGGKAD